MTSKMIQHSCYITQIATRMLFSLPLSRHVIQTQPTSCLSVTFLHSIKTNKHNFIYFHLQLYTTSTGPSYLRLSFVFVCQYSIHGTTPIRLCTPSQFQYRLTHACSDRDTPDRCNALPCRPTYSILYCNKSIIYICHSRILD